MKISARACGGFAGLAQSYELDTARAADGPALEGLLQRLDFFGAGAAGADCAVGADLPRWEIMVDDGRRCHTVFLREDGGDGDWQHLLTHLRRSV